MSKEAPKPLTYWRNIKTGDNYQVVGLSKNTTNAQDGQVLVRYIPVPWDGNDETYYSRALDEFLEKFKKSGRWQK